VQLSEGVTFSPPAVSPDEKHVAFAHPRKDGKAVGWMVSGITGEVESEFENPTFDPMSRAMNWMPDSQFLSHGGCPERDIQPVGSPSAGKRPGETAHAFYGWHYLALRVFTRWEMDRDGARPNAERRGDVPGGEVGAGRQCFRGTRESGTQDQENLRTWGPAMLDPYEEGCARARRRGGPGASSHIR
jgi:hypothetical protein